MNRLLTITAVSILFVCNTQAQTTITNVIPLNKTINVTLLGSDDDLLYCYNLYGFNYFDGKDSVVGEFIVLKDADTFKEKTNIEIKLCRVREFSLSIQGNCKKIPIENGLQLRHKGAAEPVYLNFDPLGPEPVFIPCK